MTSGSEAGTRPANNAAVMKASPSAVFGISSGMLCTFANIGMVFSYSMAILIASRSIARHLAFAFFVGSTSLHGKLAAAFTSGLHSAFYASMGLTGVAAVLSATRGAWTFGQRGDDGVKRRPEGLGRLALRVSEDRGGGNRTREDFNRAMRRQLARIHCALLYDAGR
jgi:hypothetical protein